MEQPSSIHVLLGFVRTAMRTHDTLLQHEYFARYNRHNGVPECGHVAVHADMWVQQHTAENTKAVINIVCNATASIKIDCPLAANAPPGAARARATALQPLHPDVVHRDRPAAR